MSLQDAITANLPLTALNAGHFAETLIYFPAGAPPRSIAAVVKRGRHLEENPLHFAAVETAECLVRNDPLLGMTAPRLGDAIRLAGDEATARWDFVRVESSDAAGIRVLFQRKQLHRSGQMRIPSL